MNTGHDHHHDHAPANFSRAFAIGIGLNTVFVVIEAFYGWKINSLALLADAGHNLSDVAGLVLAWEAVGRLMSPDPLAGAEGVTIMAVAGVGIVVNTVTALLFMRGGEKDLNIRGAFLHMAADALVSVGVVVAGALTLWMGWVWLDPVVSLVIAAVILLGTWTLFRQSLHLLFDGVPDSVDLMAVRQSLLDLPGVTQVHDLHVWAMGTSQIAMTAHLVTPEGHPDDAFYRAATDLLHERFEITHVTLQAVREPFMPLCGDVHSL